MSSQFPSKQKKSRFRKPDLRKGLGKNLKDRKYWKFLYSPDSREVSPPSGEGMKGASAALHYAILSPSVTSIYNPTETGNSGIVIPNIWAHSPVGELKKAQNNRNGEKETEQRKNIWATFLFNSLNHPRKLQIEGVIELRKSRHCAIQRTFLFEKLYFVNAAWSLHAMANMSCSWRPNVMKKVEAAMHLSWSSVGGRHKYASSPAHYKKNS